ncbi:MAG: biotin transporter BioY [Clostridiales bacterium]|jgi:biotin transport system substrate-specific component|nr:biotin transporter BioY [Clostridiales bacterium]
MQRTKLMLRAALAVAILAVFSQITFPIGVIPVTLSVLAVFLTAWLLPPCWAAAAALIYVLLGAFGVPIFSGFQGGISRLLGPTGGFLIAYPFMALISSRFIRMGKWASVSAEDVGGKRQADTMRIIYALIGMVLSIVLCHVLGILRLKVVMEIPLREAFLLGSLPFIPLDFAKAAVAAVMIWRLPRWIQ